MKHISTTSIRVSLIFSWLVSPVASAKPICSEGLCEVFSLVTQGRAQTGNATNSSSGNIVIFDPGASDISLINMECHIAASVPVEAWDGVRAMLESVKGVDGPPNDLNNAQQVMILFYSSIQDMLKEFSCDRAAAQWK